MNYQNHLDSIKLTLERCAESLAFELRGFAVYCIAETNGQVHFLSASKASQSIEAFEGALVDRAPLLLSSHATYKQAVESAVQGTDLIHMTMQDGPSAIYGIVYDISDDEIESFEISPGFFLLQMAFRLKEDYKCALQASAVAGKSRPVSEAIQAAIGECVSQVGMRLDIVYPNDYRPGHSGMKVPSSLLEDIQNLTYRPEEGRYAENSILCASAEPPLLELTTPVELSDTKLTRKLLDVKKLGSESVALAVRRGSKQIPEAVGFRKATEVSGNGEFHIKFVSRGIWQLLEGGDVLLEVVDFKPRFERKTSWVLEQTKSQLDTFGPHFTKNIEKLCSELLNNCHGAVIIVSERAHAEAERLKKRGTPIKPFDVVKNLSLLQSLASIDGAVLLDVNLQCHAFGVILDGKVDPRIGRSDRGSRYNSSATYAHSMVADGSKTIAFIFSSDGGLDIVVPQPLAGKGSA